MLTIVDYFTGEVLSLSIFFESIRHNKCINCNSFLGKLRKEQRTCTSVFSNLSMYKTTNLDKLIQCNYCNYLYILKYIPHQYKNNKKEDISDLN